MKICVKCKNDLPLDCFYVDKKGGKYGVRSVCKICFNDASYRYRKSISGLITQMYAQQRRNSYLRNHPYPNYTKSQLTEWLMGNPKFLHLYNNWVHSKYDRLFAPSCDRIDSLKHYTLDNLQLGTFAENHINENADIKNGLIGRASPVVGINKDTNQKFQFISAKAAERKLNVFASHISDCCLGKRKSAGNYIWRFGK